MACSLSATPTSTGTSGFCSSTMTNVRTVPFPTFCAWPSTRTSRDGFAGAAESALLSGAVTINAINATAVPTINALFIW